MVQEDKYGLYLVLHQYTCEQVGGRGNCIVVYLGICGQLAVPEQKVDRGT